MRIETGRCEIRKDGQRWLILTTICLLSALRSFCQYFISCVNEEIAILFNRRPYQIDWLSGIMSACVMPISIIVVIFSHKFNLYSITVIASVLLTSGLLVSTISVLSNRTYLLILFGQILVGHASGLLMVSPTIMSTQWFADNETATVLSLPWLFSSISSAFGAFFISYFIPLETNLVTREQWKIKVQHLLSNVFLVFLLLACVSLILCVFLIKNYPETTPSLSQINEKKLKEHFEGLSFLGKCQKNYESNVLPILMRKSYWIVTLIFCLLSSAFPMATILQSSTTRKNFPNTEGHVTGNISLVSFGIGALGGPVAGILMDRTKQFKTAQVIGITNSAVSLSIAVLIHSFLAVEGLYVSNTAILFSMEFNSVVALETLSEVIYPHNKITGMSIFMVCHSIADVAYIGLSRYALERSVLFELLLPFPFIFTATALTLFHNPIYRRHLANKSPEQ